MSNMSIKKAGIINAMSKYTNVITSLLFSVILARLLTPNDYGIIAVTTVFTSFFSILTDMGIGTGIIQNKTLSKNEIDSIFTISILFGIILSILFTFFGYPMSIFYKNTVYVPICFFLSFSLLFTTFNMVPNAIMMKEKEFIVIAKRNVFVPILTNIFAVILALYGFKYYALVMQSVLLAFFTFILNLVFCIRHYKLKLLFKFDFKGFNKIRNYSGFQFAFSLVNYFSRNLDNLLISKVFNEAILGIYDKAYKLMLYPLNMLTSVISPVLHPILSEYQDNKGYIYEQYIKVLKVLSFFGVFIVPVCFVSNYEIIYIMFGEQWISAASCFRILSISVWTQLLTSSTGAIFQSVGKTDLMLKSSLINTAITVILILIGLNMGSIEIVSAFVTISYLVNFFITFYLLIKEALEKDFIEFNKELLPDFVAVCSITLIASFVFKFVLLENVFLSLLIKSFFVFVLFSGYELFTGKYKLIKKIIK